MFINKHFDFCKEMFIFTKTYYMKKSTAQNKIIRERYAKILGMEMGKADYILKKKLLFYLAGRLDMLNCFRCGKPIETIEELSLDHTEFWLNAHNPIATFFDVEKIAFSHMKCNRVSKDISNLSECPSRAAYARGCRCEGCKQATREYTREHKRKWREENPGKESEYYRKWKEGKKLKT